MTLKGFKDCKEYTYVSQYISSLFKDADTNQDGVIGPWEYVDFNSQCLYGQPKLWWSLVHAVESENSKGGDDDLILNFVGLLVDKFGVQRNEALKIINDAFAGEECVDEDKFQFLWRAFLEDRDAQDESESIDSDKQPEFGMKDLDWSWFCTEESSEAVVDMFNRADAN